MTNLNDNALNSIARTQLNAPNGVSAMSDFGAAVSISIENDKVMEGLCFSWAKRFVIPNADSVSIIVDPTGVSDKIVVVLPIVFSAFGAGPINIDTYFGTTYSGGTAWAGINRDNNLTDPSDVVVNFDPTIVTPGTQLPSEFSIFSNGVAATSKIGGTSSEMLVLKANISGIYRFHLINTDSVDDAQCTFAMSIFEVPL